MKGFALGLKLIRIGYSLGRQSYPPVLGLLDFSKYSDIEFPNAFFTVAGVAVATMPLHDVEFSKLKSMPILVTEDGMAYVIFQTLSELTSMQEKSYHQKSIRT
jgi:hypothetical protein